jgi:hypothetical protein
MMAGWNSGQKQPPDLRKLVEKLKRLKKKGGK